MKRLITSILLIFVMTACTPPTPTEPPSIIINDPVRPTPTTAPVDERTPAQRAAVSALSEITGLPADKITLVSTESVTWSDGCLGVQRANMMCTQALVEGFKIVLEADGREYEFHTNQTGSAVVLAMGEPSGLLEEAIIVQLAGNLGLDKNDISLVSNEEVEFSDACLGVAMPDVMCAQVITQGRIVLLEAQGVQYEYHTSPDGSRIQPATLALTWKREGGIIGFCDSLTVFLSGEIYGNQCKSQPNETMGTFVSLLSATEQKQFNAWMTKYGQVDLDASDPKGVADGMTVLLSLYGNGNAQPSDDDEAALFLWAQGLFQKLYK